MMELEYYLVDMFTDRQWVGSACIWVVGSYN